MLTILETSLVELKAILLEELSGFDSEVYLFGSAASGRFSKASDIDIAIEGCGKLPAGKLARIRERIEQSNVPYRVEVVLLDEVSEAFRERVRSEGIQWNGSEND